MGRASDDWKRVVEELERANLRRRLRTVASSSSRSVILDGREVLDFSSNNYLGLADHPVLAKAAIDALRAYGVGSGASRLIVGNHDQHEQLERELARFHDSEAALLFNSGYNANLGVLQSLAGAGDVIFSDALNHASIVDGCRLSRAAVVVYPHNDVEALGVLLESPRYLGCRKLVVTDSVFSMDGDRAPLAAIARLCEQSQAVLVVDEAHATGVLGPEGRGVAREAGVHPDVRVGTLSKGFGSFGAYVAGSRELIELLLNRARSFVFTTSLPVAVVAASRAALQLIRGPEGVSRRKQLHDRIDRFRVGLEQMGILELHAGSTPIFPVHVADDHRVMRCSEHLLERGIYAQGIRPPTVPRGTSRLRFALMATHSCEDIDLALTELESMVRSGLLSPRQR